MTLSDVVNSMNGVPTQSPRDAWIYGIFGGSVPPREMKVGNKVKREQYVGGVRLGLKRDKGKPTTMLHVDLYTHTAPARPSGGTTGSPDPRTCSTRPST